MKPMRNLYIIIYLLASCFLNFEFLDGAILGRKNSVQYIGIGSWTSIIMLRYNIEDCIAIEIPYIGYFEKVGFWKKSL